MFERLCICQVVFFERELSYGSLGLCIRKFAHLCVCDFVVLICVCLYKVFFLFLIRFCVFLCFNFCFVSCVSVLVFLLGWLLCVFDFV